MTTTERDSQGDLKLEETEAAIATFESGFAKFLRSELLVIAAQKINRITFEELDLEQPNEFKLTRSAEIPPTGFPGFSKIWQGAMFVSGTNTDITAWRKN